MFFIHTMGRRSKNTTAATLDELGVKMTSLMASQANDAITVAVGKTDQAVMPYVWIRRDSETDEWEGEAGDGIRLGIEEGLLNESDPIEMLNLNEAIMAGIAISETLKPKKSQKLSEEELEVEAKRMVNNLFKSLK